MNQTLEPLKVSSLTQLEVAQLIDLHQSNIATLDSALITDEPLKNYLAGVFGKNTSFKAALKQIRKSDETEKITLADKNRDLAFGQFKKSVKLFLDSDDAAEQEAAKSLMNLINIYKDIEDLPYGAETTDIDKLIGELEGANYSEKVAFLNVGRPITRLKANNATFKTLFEGRLVEGATTETYNAKLLRKELLEAYAEMTKYVVAMANALHSEQFVSVLNLLNSARKYYADLLARRKGTNDANNPQPDASAPTA
jgi:hypothetical protein